MNGFLIINKPKGITSFDVIRKVRKVLNIRKIGHAGTLDPMATGLLILAIGEGTKLLEYLIKKEKTYEAEITFGYESETFDTEGKLTQISAKEIDLTEIQTALNNFTGKIQQIPPKYSALKIQGKKAYELAREGKEIQMKAREVEIFNIEIFNYLYPQLSLKINCSTGTYIRSIAHDLGKKLEIGGYLSKLNRIKIGTYFLKDALDLKDVDATKILPLEWGIKNFEQVKISKTEKKLLQNGQQISPKRNFNNNQIIACLFENKLISICKFSDKTKKLQSVKNFQEV